MEVDVIGGDNIEKNREKLKKKGVIIINEVFTPKMMERVYFEIFETISDGNIKFITLYINSNGGNVDALLPLVDLIDKCHKPVSTIVMGKAYSCGAMLLLAGHKGFRYAHKNSDILLHEVASGTYGKNSQVQEDARYLDRINKIFIKMIKEKTKMKDKDIDRFMNSNKDIFISSQQALRYGIIDKIL